MMIEPLSCKKNVVLSLCLVFSVITDAFFLTSTRQDIRFQHAFSSTTTTPLTTASHAASRNHEESSIRASSSTSSFEAPPLLLVPRISVKEFDPTQAVDRPLLLSNAMSTQQCDACLDILMAQAGDVVVQVQQQTHSRSDDDDDDHESIKTRLFQCTLHQAIDVIMTKSSSRQAYLAFGEGLLQQTLDLSSTSSSSSTLQEHVTRAREQAFRNGDSRGSDDSHFDWFSQFPARAQPTDADIIAGAGATSTLHRDPFEWTGTSLCLEGTKIWRFIEPPPASASVQHGVKSIDDQLNSYRLESIAWHDDDNDNDKKATETTSMSLSAGWQSDFSLYQSRLHDSIPTARELAELAETDPSQHENLLKELATDMKVLQPCPAAQGLVIHTAIQKAGDLLLIPAHWWHQTYAFEPSVAVASQRCSALDAPRVFAHILHQVTSAASQTNSQRQQQPKSKLDVSGTVSSILDKATSSQHAIDELFRIVQEHSTIVKLR